MSAKKNVLVFRGSPRRNGNSTILVGVRKNVRRGKIPDYSMTVRKDVPEEFTWKVEDIYASDGAWKSDKAAVETLIARIDDLAKDWTSSHRKMLAMLDLTSEINRTIIKLNAYAALRKDTDMSCHPYLRMQGEAQTLIVRLNSRLSFLNPDILALGAANFAEYLSAEPGLAAYRFGVENVLRSKDHILPTDEQRVASLSGLFGAAASNAAVMLNDVEIPPVRVILSDGKKIALNAARYVLYRGAKKAADRSLVMTAYWTNRKKFENTLAILQDGTVKQHLFNAQIHRHRDCLAVRLFDDDIPAEVYHRLIRSARENLAPLHRYLTLKKKLLGLKKFRYDDIYASAAVDRRYSFDEAKNLVLDALKPLGPEYLEAARASFKGRWIDIYPNKGKESGAYSSGVYGVHPFIKLNHHGKYDDISTLAHELGHAMHSHFADKTQHFANSQYSMFLAEIASTFNENLLMDHLVRNDKDDRFKLFVLDANLDRVRGTLYRQALFAEFELAMHRLAEEGQTLTADRLNDIYLGLTRTYYGHDKGVCEVGDFIRSEWSGIPHFHMNFYVFQYGTGIIASMALTDMVLDGGPAARARYLDLLKAGGSDHPIALLKKAGVDMTTPAPAAAAFRRFGRMVGEMEKIVGRLKRNHRPMEGPFSSRQGRSKKFH